MESGICQQQVLADTTLPTIPVADHLHKTFRMLHLYYFNKLPFRISKAPEHFQERMNKILTGSKGVVCHMDDKLIFGNTQAEHDINLLAAFERIQ